MAAQRPIPLSLFQVLDCCHASARDDGYVGQGLHAGKSLDIRPGKHAVAADIRAKERHDAHPGGILEAFSRTRGRASCHPFTMSRPSYMSRPSTIFR